mgnify:CR=1 FL=1
MNKLKKEYLFFKQQEPNMRTLLVTNMLYALVLPIVEIFVGAYIMRNTSDPVMVAFYQLAMYIGIITTSLVNALFDRNPGKWHFHVRYDDYQVTWLRRTWPGRLFNGGSFWFLLDQPIPAGSL